MSPVAEAWWPIALDVSQSLGAIATIVALIFLYAEVRHTTRQTEELRKNLGLSTYQALVQNEREMWDVLKDEEGFLSLFQRDLGIEIPPSMTDHAVRSLVTIASYAENLYFQHKVGSIPEVLWPGWDSYLRDFANAACFQELWPQIRHWYWDEFAQYIETLTQESDGGDNHDHLSREEPGARRC